jgi:hypothetical protein
MPPSKQKPNETKYETQNIMFLPDDFGFEFDFDFIEEFP